MDQLIRRFLESLASERNYSPNTLDAYRLDLNQTLSFLGNEMWTVEDVGRYVVHLRGKYGLASQARKIEVIRSLFRFLEGQGVVGPEVRGALKSPDVGLQKHHPKWTRAIHILVRDLAILSVMSMGIKVSQLIDITLQDLDEDRLAIGYKIFPLPDEVKRYLKHRPKTDDPHLFVNNLREGFSRQGIWLVIQRYGIKETESL